MIILSACHANDRTTRRITLPRNKLLGLLNGGDFIYIRKTLNRRVEYWDMWFAEDMDLLW
jgi:cellulose synthase/poly-beta-1,6-N-acetylglucosamine synthase-like glycosyltransferase